MPPLRPVLAPQAFVIVRDSPVSQHAALFLTAGKVWLHNHASWTVSFLPTSISPALALAHVVGHMIWPASGSI